MAQQDGNAPNDAASWYTDHDRDFDYFYDYEHIVTHMLLERHLSLEELRTDIRASVMLRGLQLFCYDSLPTYLIKGITHLVGALRFERALETAQSAITSPPPMIDEQAGAARWFVLFLLGFPPMSQTVESESYAGAATETARHTLHELLQSPVLQARWMSAISLGHMRDPSALPMLHTMLTEELPPDGAYSEYGPNKCIRWRDWIPSILAQWDAPGSRTALLGALARVIEEENEIPMPTIADVMSQGYPPNIAQRRYLDSYPRMEEWIAFEQQLIYALGYLQEYEAAERIPLSDGVPAAFVDDMYNPYSATWLGGLDPLQEPLRRHLWRVHMVMGSLETTAVATNRPPKLGLGYFDFSLAPALEEAVDRRLAEWYGDRGMDAEQRQRAMLEYGRASWLFNVTNPNSYNLLLWPDTRKADSATSTWIDIGRLLVDNE